MWLLPKWDPEQRDEWWVGTGAPSQAGWRVRESVARLQWDHILGTVVKESSSPPKLDSGLWARSTKILSKQVLSKCFWRDWSVVGEIKMWTFTLVAMQKQFVPFREEGAMPPGSFPHARPHQPQAPAVPLLMLAPPSSSEASLTSSPSSPSTCFASHPPWIVHSPVSWKRSLFPSLSTSHPYVYCSPLNFLFQAVPLNVDNQP
jgi:hypothetical protein